jgi:RNA recognition motif-containing protein
MVGMQLYSRLTSLVSCLQEQYFHLIAKSSTLYIGNLAFVTTEEQVGC